MRSLREWLKQLLPSVLPKDPESAINGAFLYDRIRTLLPARYAEASVRHHFSVMASEGGMPIAKIKHGHGYYLRPAVDSGAPEQAPIGDVDYGAHQVETGGGDLARTHRRDRNDYAVFRALLLRVAESQHRMPIFVRRSLRMPRKITAEAWVIPDVVLVEWGGSSPGGGPTCITSVQLHVTVTREDYREAFFRCVSNSSWAHQAQLAIATTVADSDVAQRLARLGDSYGVAITTFGIDTAQLRHLPSAEEIATLAGHDVEALEQHLQPSMLSSGRTREQIDMAHLHALAEECAQCGELLEWMATHPDARVSARPARHEHRIGELHSP